MKISKRKKNRRFWMVGTVVLTLGFASGSALAGFSNFHSELTDMINVGCDGEKLSIINVLAVVGFVWTQVRQLIPIVWISKLPAWLITLLEFFAGNRGTASNDLSNDPCHSKLNKSFKISG